MNIKTLVGIVLLSSSSISVGENSYINKTYEVPVIEVSSRHVPKINPIKYIDRVIDQELKPTQLITKRFVKRIITMESDYDSLMIGSSGERGLMQIMPDTYDELMNHTFDSAFYVRPNVHAGIKMLKQLERTLSRNHPYWSDLSKLDKLRTIGAAYNGGYGLLSRNNFDINLMKNHTKRYVNKIN